MTYCMGLLVDDGLAMLADTRTNAGVDNIATYRKLRLVGRDGDRRIVIASAGSLSTTQAAIHRLERGVAAEGEEPETLATAVDMVRVAELVGQALHESKDAVDKTVGTGVRTDATLLVGGAVGPGPARLFLIYGAGNFIECDRDTPFLQIGEHKYGKPILDRLLARDTPLAEAVKIGLLSMNSTMRSNLAVGPPIDLAVVRPGPVATTHRIEEDDPYWQELGARWLDALRGAAAAIPAVPYGVG